MKKSIWTIMRPAYQDNLLRRYGKGEITTQQFVENAKTFEIDNFTIIKAVKKKELENEY